MAEEETKVTIDVWGTKKPEGEVDKAKATKDLAAPPAAEGEVEGHWHHHHHWHGGGPFWRVGIGGGGGGWTSVLELWLRPVCARRLPRAGIHLW